jgi:hypothetical protein
MNLETLSYSSHNLTTSPNLNTVDTGTVTELTLTVDNPIPIVLVHFKNGWESPRKGLLRFRADGMMEWLDHHFDGLETILEPYYKLRQLSPYYYIYVSPSGNTGGKWHELEFTPGSKGIYDWKYESDRAIIPATPCDFKLGGK